MTKIRVLLADDHVLVRAGIRTLLEKQADIEVLGEASDGEEALEAVRRLRPAVVVMDLSMPKMDGLDTTRLIKEKFPEVHILILSMHEDDRRFFEAIRAGAAGYIVKGALPSEFLAAVRAVAQGQVHLSPVFARKLIDDHVARSENGNAAVVADGLTPREKEVLIRIAQGKTSKEIAKELGINVHTVERHRQNVMAKLNVHNRAELIRYALGAGLV